MKTTFLKRTRKATSGTLVLTLLFSVLSPWMNSISPVYAAIDPPVISEIIPVPTPGNDSTPNYTFTSSKAGTIIYSGSCSSATTGANTGLNTITFNVLSEWVHSDCIIIVSAIPPPQDVSLPLAITPFTIDTTTPIIASTWSVATGTWSASFSGIAVTELHFSGATLMYSWVANSFLSGTIALDGTVSELTGSLSGLDSNATYYYEITVSDMAGNTATLPAGTFSTLFDYAALYNQIGTILAASGITNNFTGVTNDNVMSFPNLEFGNTFWKITFVNNMDLTDLGTISYLQDLGSKFSAGAGNTIGLTTSWSTFQWYPAIITATFPSPILPNGTGSENMVVVRDDAGNILDWSGILSNMTCAISIFWDQTCFFNTAHFTTFDFKPTAQVEYSDTGSTNQNVIATLTGASEAITVTNNSGALAKTFTANGSFTFEFVDNAGNTGSTTATVANIDQIAPVVTLIGSGALTIALGSVYTDSGATWTDNVDGTGISIASGTVNTSATGTYILTYTQTDAAGNTSDTETRTVTVTDQTAPVVTLVGSGIVTVNYGSVYTDSGATWTDNLDGTGTVTASGTVDTLTLGSYTLTYTKTDIAGNISNTETRTVEIIATPVTGSGTIEWPADLTGSTISSWSWLDTSWLVLLITSTGSDADSLSGTLTVSGVTLITVSGSTWNGVLIPPTSIASGSTDNATLGELWGFVPQDTSTTDYTSTILQTIQAWWQSGVSLIASGANFQISVQVSNGTAGDVLKLYRSFNGTDWVANTPDATCTLTVSKMCTFSTDHLSFFSMVKTTSVAISQSIGGGGGNSSTDYCPAGDTSESYYDRKCSNGTTFSGSISVGSGVTTEVTKIKNEVIVTTTTASGTTTTVFTIPGLVLKDLKDMKFTDISGHWAKGYIQKLVARGIIDNIEKYNPDHHLTRAEFLKIVFNTAGWQVGTGITTVFTDVTSDAWYAPYISLAVSKGIVSDKSAVFRPNDTISRAEAAKIIVGIFGGNTANRKATFADVDEASDFMKYIETAKELGFFSGQVIDGKLHFRPNDAITRSEIAKVIVSAFGL